MKIITRRNALQYLVLKLFFKIKLEQDKLNLFVLLIKYHGKINNQIGLKLSILNHMHNHETIGLHPMPWQPWPPKSQNPSWAQAWKNNYGKYPQNPQFQQPCPSFPLQYYPQPSQPYQFQNPNQQISIPFPQKPNQLPAQSLPNPNNKNKKAIYNVEGKKFQASMITPLGLNDVQLRSGRVLQNNSPTTAIKKSKEDEFHEKYVNLDQENIPLKENVLIQ